MDWFNNLQTTVQTGVTRLSRDLSASHEQDEGTAAAMKKYREEMKRERFFANATKALLSAAAREKQAAAGQAAAGLLAGGRSILGEGIEREGEAGRRQLLLSFFADSGSAAWAAHARAFYAAVDGLHGREARSRASIAQDESEAGGALQTRSVAGVSEARREEQTRLQRQHRALDGVLGGEDDGRTALCSAESDELARIESDQVKLLAKLREKAHGLRRSLATFSTSEAASRMQLMEDEADARAAVEAFVLYQADQRDEACEAEAADRAAVAAAALGAAEACVRTLALALEAAERSRDLQPRLPWLRELRGMFAAECEGVEEDESAGRKSIGGEEAQSLRGMQSASTAGIDRASDVQRDRERRDASEREQCTVEEASARDVLAAEFERGHAVDLAVIFAEGKARAEEMLATRAARERRGKSSVADAEAGGRAAVLAAEQAARAAYAEASALAGCEASEAEARAAVSAASSLARVCVSSSEHAAKGGVALRDLAASLEPSCRSEAAAAEDGAWAVLLAGEAAGRRAAETASGIRAAREESTQQLLCLDESSARAAVAEGEEAGRFRLREWGARRRLAGREAAVREDRWARFSQTRRAIADKEARVLAERAVSVRELVVVQDAERAAIDEHEADSRDAVARARAADAQSLQLSLSRRLAEITAMQAAAVADECDLREDVMAEESRCFWAIESAAEEESRDCRPALPSDDGGDWWADETGADDGWQADAQGEAFDARIPIEPAAPHRQSTPPPPPPPKNPEPKDADCREGSASAPPPSSEGTEPAKPAAPPPAPAAGKTGAPTKVDARLQAALDAFAAAKARPGGGGGGPPEPAGRREALLSPLHHAAAGDDYPGVLALVKTRKYASAWDSGLSATPLMVAAAHSSVSALRALLDSEREAKRTLNRQDPSGRTALHRAVAECRLGAIMILLDAFADVSVADHKGSTPLHLAASTGSGSAVEALQQYGADPSLRDGDGRLPKDCWPPGAEVPGFLDAPPSPPRGHESPAPFAHASAEARPGGSPHLPMDSLSISISGFEPAAYLHPPPNPLKRLIRLVDDMGGSYLIPPALFVVSAFFVWYNTLWS
ncbi:E3 ubiquitin-protein ligase XB3 [Diplonema papillatum]|nr:E3 ubiquitin-protein ligase XB3 [Diplonema papillatum]